MRRVLVLGGSGMLGHVLAQTLVSAGHPVFTTIRTEWSGKDRLAHFVPRELVIDKCPVAQPAELDRAILTANPDVIVNCIGVIKQKEGIADNVLTVGVNALLPHQIVQAADLHGARVIQISTDCVYSGLRGHYAESDLPDPADFYGRSKLLGEVASPHLTLRTSLVGWQISGAESLFEWFLTQRGRTITGYRAAYFSGLTTPAISHIIARVIADEPGLSGIYHLAAPRISKFDLLSALNDRLGHPVEINADDHFTIDRSLDGSRFFSETGIAVPQWAEMLDESTLERKNYDDN